MCRVIIAGWDLLGISWVCFVKDEQTEQGEGWKERCCYDPGIVTMNGRRSLSCEARPGGLERDAQSDDELLPTR